MMKTSRRDWRQCSPVRVPVAAGVLGMWRYSYVFSAGALTAAVGMTTRQPSRDQHSWDLLLSSMSIALNKLVLVHSNQSRAS